MLELTVLSVLPSFEMLEFSVFSVPRRVNMLAFTVLSVHSREDTQETRKETCNSETAH